MANEKVKVRGVVDLIFCCGCDARLYGFYWKQRTEYEDTATKAAGSSSSSGGAIRRQLL